MSTLVISGKGTQFRAIPKDGKTSKIAVLTSKGIKTVSVANSTDVKYAA